MLGSKRGKLFRTLLIITVMLGVVLAMSVTALAEEKPLEVGTVYKAGDTINVPSGDDIYLIWDDDEEFGTIPNKIAPGTYTLGEPQFDGVHGQFFIQIGDDPDDGLFLGKNMSLTGDEDVTGIKCYKGEGTEEDPYEFKLIIGEEGSPVTYLAWDDQEKKLVEETCTDYTALKSATGNKEIGERNGGESWYVVNEDVNIEGALLTWGDTNLIIADGKTLSVEDYIYAQNGSLNIYAQSEGANAGAIKAKSQIEVEPISTWRADLVINGGKITTNSTYIRVASISGDTNVADSDKGNVTINGGEINASSNGRGIEAYGRCLTINGGTINVTSAGDNGIYGKEEVIINGGVVNAVSNSSSEEAGIATEDDGSGGTVEINGGTVLAKCTNEGAGIDTTDLYINGGDVTAIGHGVEEGSNGIYAHGDDPDIDIAEGLKVLAGNDEKSAADVTEKYKGQYAEKLVEDYVCVCVPVGINNAKAVLSANAFVYNGKVRKPAIKTIKGMKLREGIDYTVKWSNASPKSVGPYTVTITGKGRYTGVTKTTYKIIPKGTTLKTPKRGKKAVTVKWRKQSAKMAKSRITGYRIMLATNSKFTKNKKTVDVKGYKKVSKKIRKLKGGKKYYIKIRTYKTVNGKRYYSNWSKVRTVKTRR